MRSEELRERIGKALDAEMSGMRVTPSRQEAILNHAIGGVKVKRKLTVGLVLAIVLTLLLAAAAAVTAALLSAEEVVQEVAVPLAQGNDREWRVETSFSPEQLAEFIRACDENGIDMSENEQIMEALRSGEGYDEEEAIMAVCRVAFGGTIGEWTIAQRHWFWDVMVQIGWVETNNEDIPGPDDLEEGDARARMTAAIQAAYGPDLPLEDREQYQTHIAFIAGGAEDGTFWYLQAEPRDHGWGHYYSASLDKAGEVLEVTHREEVRPDPSELPPEPAFTLTEEEAVHLAAEAIRGESGRDVPLEDPEKYHWNTWKEREGNIGWHVSFISHTGEWGNCTAFVRDATGEVTVGTADVDGITADNILARYRAQYGWYDTWDSARWAEIAQWAADLPEAETMVGKVTKATPWIAWREGLLTRDEAEEQAFRRAGVRMGDVNCVSLIDAEPNPVWKFRILPWDSDYDDTIVVEIDAVTGEMTDLDPYKSDHSDLEPSFHMVTLHRIWARLELEENGPLYLARLAVLHTFANLGFDMPEVDDIPIFDLRYWVPEVDGNTVRFRSQWLECPDYEVELDENGVPVRVEEKESGSAEPLPPELDRECLDESLYEVNNQAMAAAQEAYGVLTLLWPLEVQAEVYPHENRSVPREGEMSLEEAVAFAKEQLPPEAGDFPEPGQIGAQLYRLNEGTDDEFTRWTIFFMPDGRPIDCWRVTFVDKGHEHMTRCVDVKEPGDDGNG